LSNTLANPAVLLTIGECVTNADCGDVLRQGCALRLEKRHFVPSRKAQFGVRVSSQAARLRRDFGAAGKAQFGVRIED